VQHLPGAKQIARLQRQRQCQHASLLGRTKIVSPQHASQLGRTNSQPTHFFMNVINSKRIFDNFIQEMKILGGKIN
jgi:hypothetical protein